MSIQTRRDAAGRRDRRTVGIVLVDHGSKIQAANDMLLEVVELYRRVTGALIVEPAHMELAEPTIEQAFESCVRQGAREVVVHPYFLSPGRHSTHDIPRMARAAAERHRDVPYSVTEPLGLDEQIAHVIQQRIEECLRGGADDGEDRAPLNPRRTVAAAAV